MLQAVDSDSGGPEVQSLIARSLSQLKHSEMAWSKLSKANPLLVMAKDFVSSTLYMELKLVLKYYIHN